MLSSSCQWISPGRVSMRHAPALSHVSADGADLAWIFGDQIA
ncbi:hypothetical protein SAMN04489832_0935 [Micromonospora cremea]|uniref:Uncharacterized protein n=1 Tax=Micromonospora cremea TaxID=709881 RepID=A0A1N5UI24_9ACTN|nr:hypothetical protein SAMN04489832_0935 [Micromonospora cremea]